MSRPTRCRRVCGVPEFNEFVPNGEHPLSIIVLKVDEYETIRLIDYEGKTQDECAKLMNVSRPTITDIYTSARYKISSSIINGYKLVIEGGSYELCDGKSLYCKKMCPMKRNFTNLKKGENIMRIAVTYENGNVFQHFGHTEQFKIYDVEENKIINETIVNTNGSGHGALAKFLQAYKVDALICGGIGGGAIEALTECNIKIYGGVVGPCDEKVNDLLNDKLEYNPNVKCSHHDHGEHSCGEGGCGHHELKRKI